MMILYQEDFRRYNAFPDVTTKNLSFLRMVKLLESLGVENRYFFLALHDKELQGVDPFKVDSQELHIRIAEETSNNIWYYLRELVRVPSIGGAGVSRLELNRFVLAFTWLTFNNMDTMSIILRQIGKSTIMFAIDCYILHFYASNYSMAFMSKDVPAIQEAVERIKIIRDGLPSGLIYLTRQDGDNKEGLVYTGLNNTLKTFVAQPSILGARKISRGLTIPYIQIDELVYFKNIAVTYPSALATSDAAREQAARAGLISVVNLASTAGDPTTPEGKYAFKLKNTCAEFHEKVYDTPNREATVELLKAASPRQMWHVSYNHRQLGKTDAWLADRRARTTASDSEFARDYESRWVSDESKGGLDEDTIRRLTNHQIDPLYTYINNNLLFRWYEAEATLTTDEFLDQPLVLGMDGSENVARDFTSLFLINTKTLRTVMTCQTNDVNLAVFGRVIFDLLVGFPKAIFIPERNHIGSMMADLVIDLMIRRRMNPFKRIYNTVVQDAPTIKDIEEGDISGTTKGKFGFRTSGGKKGSRSLLYGTVIDRYLSLAAEQVLDKITVDQLSQLELRNGRLDHPEGGNDDMVIAALLTVYLIFFGRNLSYYGIKPEDLYKEPPKVVNSDGNTPTMTTTEYQTLIRELVSLKVKLDTPNISTILRTACENRITRIELELEGINYMDDVTSLLELHDNDQNSLAENKPTIDRHRLQTIRW